MIDHDTLPLNWFKYNRKRKPPWIWSPLATSQFRLKIAFTNVFFFLFFAIRACINFLLYAEMKLAYDSDWQLFDLDVGVFCTNQISLSIWTERACPFINDFHLVDWWKRWQVYEMENSIFSFKASWVSFSSVIFNNKKEKLN